MTAQTHPGSFGERAQSRFAKAGLCFFWRRTVKTIASVDPRKIDCKALKGVAPFYKHIREPALQVSQFPPVLTDKQGPFHNPPAW